MDETCKRIAERADSGRGDARSVVSQMAQIVVSVLIWWLRVPRSNSSNLRFSAFKSMPTPTSHRHVVV
ncbi:hypothetical protein [Niveibacterium umoris]|uniref:Uncharacterized protein n=1 Tax=Niveibacterium umoris TaxID=1193620 RepID=A0A840BNI0_9RHOO|nr:hypothetical protein [Niveibacterium umoris]MBB4012027.1 hypothetical protein [Niveibacterium umoris]